MCLVSNWNGNGYFYLNGVETRMISGGLAPSNSGMYLGTYYGRFGGSGDYYFNGILDDVMTFPTSLSPAQVLEVKDVEL